MSLQTLAYDIADRALAHRVAAALQDLLVPAPDALTLFEKAPGTSPETGWRIDAYFAEPPDVAAIHKALQEYVGTPLAQPQILDVPEENWVALSQQALPPVAAGRFHVHGSHDSARIPQGPNAIRIEAGEAFGTAHHATTYGCLLALDRLTRRRAFHDVLDLGSGSGVLAIALARALPHARITASDLDHRSVEVARENAKANRVAARIRTHVAAGLCAPALRRAAPFDLVVANILAEPLIALAPAIARSLRPGGVLVLSGLLVPQAPAVISAYRAQGLALTAHERHAGWSTLVLTKRAVAPSRAHA